MTVHRADSRQSASLRLETQCAAAAPKERFTTMKCNPAAALSVLPRWWPENLEFAGFTLWNAKATKTSFFLKCDAFNQEQLHSKA